MNPKPASGVANQGRSSMFLDRLADPERGAFGCGDVLVVVAHPDDETIGIGGQLARLQDVRMVHVTDGAPADMKDADAYGFSAREDYAAARRKELEAAMAVAGIDPASLLTLGAVDQTAAQNMAALARRLVDIIREQRIATLVTHAYEGGHPDHDATAFIAHAASHIAAGEGEAGPDVIEMPLYRVRDGRFVMQDFVAAPSGKAIPEITLPLDEAALAAKRRMLDAHVTQRSMLASFNSPVERFRPAPSYDFGSLPNGGELLYERFDWKMTGKDWLALTACACRELGLPRWF